MGEGVGGVVCGCWDAGPTESGIIAGNYDKAVV